ncbi:bifunctional DNA primase/polymerase [Sphingomonas crocodyli]|nr:bifunctional DNA primase/polymerase [Sphingomonas crocodyli]
MSPETGFLDRPNPPTQYYAVVDALLDNEYTGLLPIKDGGKQAALKGWNDPKRRHRSREAVLHEANRFAYFGVAIVCGDVIAIDIDVEDEAEAARLEAIVREEVAGEPLVRIGRWPRRALFFRASEKIATAHGDGYDILGAGSYVVCFGIHPLTGKPYYWCGRSPLDTKHAELALITSANVKRLQKRLKARLETMTVATESENNKPINCLVADGRDKLLRDIIFAIWQQGIDDVHKLAELGWREFELQADLRRPKRSGSTSWAFEDALEKARYTIKRAADGDIVRGFGDSTLRYQPRFESFAQAINTIAAFGRWFAKSQPETAVELLPPAAVKISQLMLCLCRDDRGCFASVETLVRLTDYSIPHVKRVRATLVSRGYWSRHRYGKGRGHITEYRPCVEFTVAEAKKVSFPGAWISSGVGGDDQASASSNFKNENSNNINEHLNLTFLVARADGEEK